MQKSLKELGFTRPTPVQAEAIPPAVEGRDVLACAMTGSGKTAAFLLPILNRLIDQPRRTTRALILTPTRELAAQILEDCNALAIHTPVTAAAIYGGVGMGPQEHAFRSGVDVLVATPGRLLDHFKFSYARLTGVEVLVLDEADRMLDMGFLPDIKRVLRHVPAKRQTLFFSATMPPPIAALTRDMLRDPVLIRLQREAAPAVGITQAVYPVPQDLKVGLLIALLQRGEIDDALVFTRTKHRADRLAKYLSAAGIPVDRIHGNRSQSQRTAALRAFKSGRVRVLVATDIVARGIDITELGHVVNFDVPAVPEDYIHRVGRTARAAATGDAFTFVSPAEEEDLRGIERALGKRLPRVTVPDFDYTARGEVPPPAPRPQARRSGQAKRRPPEGAHGKTPAAKPVAGPGAGAGAGARPARDPNSSRSNRRRRWRGKQD
ncbi:MAG TPA: DEAD/DEAH box helicase [Gemmatimonadales bacterium]